MEYCDLKKNKQTGEAKGFAYINYSTPQAALMVLSPFLPSPSFAWMNHLSTAIISIHANFNLKAKDQMDGYEYPVGNALKVMFAEPLGVKGSGSSSETPAVSAVSYPYPPHYPHYPSHTPFHPLYTSFPGGPKTNTFRIPQ